LARVRVVVVGGAGFVGRQVVRQLLDRGACVLTVDLQEPANVFVGEDAAIADISDLEVAERVAERAGSARALVWLAATIRQSPVVDDAAHTDLRVMVESPLRFARALRPPPASIVYLSSIQVYGRPHTLPVDETQPTRPFTVYGVAKLCGEKYLTIFGNRVGVPVASLRAAFIYGPGQHSANVIPRFLAAVRNGQAPVIHGSGDDVRDDVHVRDVAVAVARAIEGGATGPFNVASGRPHTIREVAETVCRVAGGGLTPKFAPVDSEWFDRWYSVERAQSELGMGEPVDFEEAIREMWALELA
jgi:UDP-glucose 4-epimerase